eukprot:TRINITY_DN15643_c0_g1_i1.p1 TRINITY_DN15643_c0_g1~~TRINITY_DN15643_c0_g1_i1.p1  ORF type:complete len:126 (-),score=28.16 TRINITY_DN15643_c0_g1_i1:100-477(-)
MKTVCLVLVVICVTTALARKKGVRKERPKKPKPGKPESGELGPKEKMPGVCLSMEDVKSLCVGNTTIATKLENAKQTCSAVPDSKFGMHYQRKGKGKGNGQKGKGKGQKDKRKRKRERGKGKPSK